MQIQKEVKTIGPAPSSNQWLDLGLSRGEAKKLRFSVLAGDELSTRTEEGQGCTLLHKVRHLDLCL